MTAAREDLRAARDRLARAAASLDETRLTPALHDDVARVCHVLRLWNEIHDVPTTSDPPVLARTYVATRRDGRTAWRTFPRGTPLSVVERWLADAFGMPE